MGNTEAKEKKDTVRWWGRGCSHGNWLLGTNIWQSMPENHNFFEQQLMKILCAYSEPQTVWETADVGELVIRALKSLSPATLLSRPPTLLVWVTPEEIGAERDRFNFQFGEGTLETPFTIRWTVHVAVFKVSSFLCVVSPWQLWFIYQVPRNTPGTDKWMLFMTDGIRCLPEVK